MRVRLAKSCAKIFSKRLALNVMQSFWSATSSFNSPRPQRRRDGTLSLRMHDLDGCQPILPYLCKWIGSPQILQRLASYRLLERAKDQSSSINVLIYVQTYLTLPLPEKH